MPERLAVLAAVVLFGGWHWQQLERPQIAAAELALLAVLATLPGLLAALGRRRWAVASIPVVVWMAVWVWVNGPMRVFNIHWRFFGGRLI